MEVIHLRDCRPDKRPAVAAVFQDLMQQKMPRMLRKLALYRSLMVEGDLALLLSWDGTAASTGRSPLGMKIADALSSFGAIYHTSWASGGPCCGGEGPRAHAGRTEAGPVDHDYEILSEANGYEKS